MSRAWVSMEAVKEAVHSKGLLGYLEATYNKAVPCTLQLRGFDTMQEMVEVEFRRPGWGLCRFKVPTRSVFIEARMKSTSLPLIEFIRLRQFLVARL